MTNCPAPANPTYAPAGFPDLEQFFAGNHNWSATQNATNPDYFPKLAEGQAPPLVWIGCADSRVPESIVLDQVPGQVFTTVSSWERARGTSLRCLRTMDEKCSHPAQHRQPGPE